MLQNTAVVASHESELLRIVSVHKDASEPWDWKSLSLVDPPEKPTPKDDSERAAQIALDVFSPTLADRLLSRAGWKREALEKAVLDAREQDRQQNAASQEQYVKDYAEWQKLRDVAKGILDRDLEAYKQAIQETTPFSDISDLCPTITLRSSAPWYMEATIRVLGEDLIPSESKALTQAGKMSVKKMSAARLKDTHQDYVCSCILRVGRELFALLPIEMAFVHAQSDLLNTATGYRSAKTIVSVALTRPQLDALAFDTIDPSDAVQAFVHHLEFTRGRGFAEVEALDPSAFTPKSN
ncbi:MAG TPA: hypothetical protein VJN96_07350 [Vicinamibacterales bacterium]|nr:hypothetical protein [Vicinamibacterales bacterium]